MPNFFAEQDAALEGAARQGSNPAQPCPALPNSVTSSLLLLWRRRRTITRGLLTGFTLSVALAFLFPKSWESTARLMPPDQSSTSGLGAAMLGKAVDAMGMVGGGGGGGLDLPGLEKNSGALFLGIMRSRTAENDVIDRLDLRRVYNVKTYEQARDILERRTEVSEDRRSGIIRLTVTDRDPVRAKDICQAYVDELNLLVARSSTSAARRERIFLEGRLTEVRHEIEEAGSHLAEFSSANRTVDPTVQGKAMLEAASKLKEDLVSADAELQSLRQLYTADNVRVRAAEAKVSTLRRELERMSGVNDSRPIDGLDVPSLRKLPMLGQRYADYYRELKTKEILFQVLTQQYEMSRVKEAREIPTVKILDAPHVPERKSFPKRLQFIIAGTGLAFIGTYLVLLIGIAWARLENSHEAKQLVGEIVQSLRNNGIKFKRTTAGV